MPFIPSAGSNLSSWLESALSAQQVALIRLVAEEASRRHLPLFIVGGFVRDLLLKHPCQDYDLVVEGDAVQLAQSMASKFGGRVVAHNRFRTAKWHLSGAAIRGIDQPESSLPHFLDFITARKESYPHPGALPVVQPGSLGDDLRRRDFSLNTLALRLDGEHFGGLRNDLNGLEDLKRGIIRVLHPHSYLDDPTRILRAVRYEQRYGFRIAPSDLEYIAEARPALGTISGDRIRHELDSILAEENAPRALARLAGLKLLKIIHPKLPWGMQLRKRLESGLTSDPPENWGHLPAPARIPRRVSLGYLLWLMDLSVGEIEGIASRLRFPASLREDLLAASRLASNKFRFARAKPSAVVEMLKGLPPFAIYARYLIEGMEVREVLNRYMVEWRHVTARTTGEELKERGVIPGPNYQVILDRLRQAWLDGEVRTIPEELSLLEEILRSMGYAAGNR